MGAIADLLRFTPQQSGKLPPLGVSWAYFRPSRAKILKSVGAFKRIEPESLGLPDNLRLLSKTGVNHREHSLKPFPASFHGRRRCEAMGDKGNHPAYTAFNERIGDCKLTAAIMAV